MQFRATELAGVVIVEPDVHRDARGYFLETYHAGKYGAGGIRAPFVQDNQSCSSRNTIRGLHMQLRKPQGKLVRVLAGEIWDVAVDVRASSPTFGRWVATVLSSDNFSQLYIPEGCAHGFCVLSQNALIEYKCTALYDPGDEVGIAYDDGTLAIPWPTNEPTLSNRDQRNPTLAEFLERVSLTKEVALARPD